jgi:sugar phosphate isomerase/epimerase
MRNNPLGLFIVPDAGLDMRLHVAKTLQIPTAHILTPPAQERTRANAALLAGKFAEAGIKLTVVFCGFAGESYASIAEVERTVGLAPEATCEERLQECKQIAQFAQELQVNVIGLHLGFIPEAVNSKTFKRLIRVTRELCDYCEKNGQWLHLETGQEKAVVLLDFIQQVDRVNLAVNFDPANMILYGAGEPISALRLLGHRVKSVHCKDAKWSAYPGKEWGAEVLQGRGDVNWEAFFVTLNDLDYRGPLTIEREITGEEQLEDIKKAVVFVNNLRQKM